MARMNVGATPLAKALSGCAMVATLTAALTAALSGCASLNTVNSEVTSFGNWPEGRDAGSFVFERLPSQQSAARAQTQDAIEASARAALLAAGFKPAEAPDSANVIVQTGVRITEQEASPWDDPYWWPGAWHPWGGAWAGAGWGPYGRWHYGPGAWRWGGPWGAGAYGWGPGFNSPGFEREVALLIRDRASGQPLFEAHASSDGYTAGGTKVLTAMFQAALQGFPKADEQPRSVGVQLAP